MYLLFHVYDLLNINLIEVFWMILDIRRRRYEFYIYKNDIMSAVIFFLFLLSEYVWS